MRKREYLIASHRNVTLPDPAVHSEDNSGVHPQAIAVKAADLAAITVGVS